MQYDQNRRRLLRYFALLGLAAFGTTPAFAKAAKSLVKYQDTPNSNGDKCADCNFFNPGDHTCKVVEGDISPEGWCTYFSKRPTKQ
jgi:hypothetical protein